MRFFDLNPFGKIFVSYCLLISNWLKKYNILFYFEGRIINRFSKDISVIDEHLPHVLFEFLQLTMILLGSLVLAVFINFWILIAIVSLFFISVYIRKFFISTLNELKRLEGICNFYNFFKKFLSSLKCSAEFPLVLNFPMFLLTK